MPAFHAHICTCDQEFVFVILWNFAPVLFAVHANDRLLYVNPSSAHRKWRLALKALLYPKRNRCEHYVVILCPIACICDRKTCSILCVWCGDVVPGVMCGFGGWGWVSVCESECDGCVVPAYIYIWFLVDYSLCIFMLVCVMICMCNGVIVS